MRVLLDTNIVIHRENRKVTNYSIGHLYRWIDKMKYSKIVHPYTVEEISKYLDTETKETMAVKLESYEIIKTVKEPSDEFMNKISIYKTNQNDLIDNCLLFEVYNNRIDILITEDRKMIRKSEKLGIRSKVFSINQFISIMTSRNPELVDYTMLSVKKTYFGNVDLQLAFFDSFREDYNGFDNWFNKKCDEIAYICRDEELLLGFLYLKREDESENYLDIIPQFKRAKRLKVGTFKVESTGFRLGERFIKIIFDNAIQYNVDEIYITAFIEREETNALINLLYRWGFIKYGVKRTNSGDEIVLIKSMKYNNEFSVKKNFPNLKFNHQKFILPILSEFHTTLLPDSKLCNENEIDFMGKVAHRYALQKVYISWSIERNIYPGDYILFYRMGDAGTVKKYTSVITTIGIVDEIIYNFNSRDDFMKHSQNRSVFTTEKLYGFWKNHRNNLMILKFIFVKSITKRLTLEYLWGSGIIESPNGPRPFTKITDEQFNLILEDSKTNIKYN